MIQNRTHLQQRKNSSPNSHQNENTQYVNQNPSHIKHEKYATSKHV
jgi:hypothetical protein